MPIAPKVSGSVDSMMQYTYLPRVSATRASAGRSASTCVVSPPAACARPLLPTAAVLGRGLAGERPSLVALVLGLLFLEPARAPAGFRFAPIPYLPVLPRATRCDLSSSIRCTSFKSTSGRHGLARN